mmetsp:Transcript_18583/g.25762  ORF Transcript_18583/g.25762 Transcript_18583/m.25762 type:complete len:244 (+) Transcript_18583:71-802(+)|eukprot:CAMPEP_0196595548 /NCGR_PEP_ID=MMETSP1081-20130531/81348_1 /TAXON_ID=36882 /ORGANISM="Pyramimonas amylifera, Strain CCMP720" /LENGTH=243 /DNA_ID=CAMNT_0041920159 /DNA_START=71 /DNA_END=802 /DNA_ORIENTATION=-
MHSGSKLIGLNKRVHTQPTIENLFGSTGQLRPSKVSRVQENHLDETQEPIKHLPSTTLAWSVLKGTVLCRSTISKPSLEVNEKKIKVASFDLDGTLVRTKSGSTFAKDAKDYVLFNEFVKEKMQALHRDGYRVVILSNQGGVGKALEGKRATATRGRIENIAREVGVPLEALCACGKDAHRKPEGGMWALVTSHLLPACAQIHTEGSFYVGDAAGRPQDFADSDKKFAEGVGVKFYTPEEFFK